MDIFKWPAFWSNKAFRDVARLELVPSILAFTYGDILKEI
jgi:hypothetical protein